MTKDGEVMLRRFLALAASLTFAVVTMANTGCESLKQAIRFSDADEVSATSMKSGGETVDSDPSKIHAVDSDGKNPQPFFKNNRRSGGWSSEAREIESHLGVGP
jgi:hypothetical protein